MPVRIAALKGAAIIIILSIVSAYAHEGHDHGDKPVVPLSVSARAENSTDAFELVAAVNGSALELYLDDFKSNAPVDGAEIEVETPDGPKKADAKTGQPYRLEAPFVSKPGRYDLIATVTSGNLSEVFAFTLEIPTIVADQNIAGSKSTFITLIQPVSIAILAAGLILGLILSRLLGRRSVAAAVLFTAVILVHAGPSFGHEGHDHGDEKQPLAVSGEAARRLPDGTIFVPKSLQRLFVIRTVFTESGAYKRTLELPGRIIPDPNTSGYVQASVGGRLSAPPGGFPRLGKPVNAGDILAYVTPPLQAIDVSDMRQRQGELDQQISIVKRRLDRYEKLAVTGAVARSQLEDTKLELEGLQDRRVSLDKSRRDPEALIAPVAGVIADGTPLAGQMAQPNAVIFHIVDPDKLWVEALSFDAVPRTAAATAQTSTGNTLSLAYRGSGFADRNQTIPVHFAVSGNTSGVRAGQMVTVLVSTDEEKKGIAVPRASVVRGANGQDFVFEHVSAERFAARPVRVEPLDGEKSLILGGLEPGRRIVAQGAELIDHVR